MIKTLLALACLAGVAHADYNPPAFLANAPALPAGYDASTALRLDLSGALQLAIEHNLGLSLQRRSVDESRIAADGASRAMYEPTVTATYQHNSSTTPPATIQAGQPGDTIVGANDSGSVGISLRLPTGGSLSLGYNMGRSATTAGTAVLPLTYGDSVTFGITQPLVRGFSTDLAIPQYSILTARIGSEQAKQQLSIAAAGLVQQTEAAYWQVVGALYAYGVAVDSQKVAQDTVDLTRRQIAAGIVAPAELTEAEATLANRRLDVMRAAAAVESEWDALRVVLALPHEDWSRPILPVEVPRFDATPTPAIDDAITLAMSHRPEVRQMELDNQLGELAMRKLENDALPQIDLSIGGQLQGQDATAHGAIGEIGAHDFSGWYAGVSLTWTPLHQASDTAAHLARVQQDVRDTTHEQRVQSMWVEVRSAVRAHAAAREQVIAAAQARELAVQGLELENKKYMSGQSSSIMLAQVQERVAGAEMSELQALIDNQRASAGLLLATGQLLDARHVVLQCAATPECGSARSGAGR